MKVSVIIPTHNRPDKLASLIECLRVQDLKKDDYEIIVVDDGSIPPVKLPEQINHSSCGPKCSLIRLEGLERSAARNAGASMADGVLLVFVDDDMTVKQDFLSVHWRAQQEWPESMCVGAIHLPKEFSDKPFVRFRQKLEKNEVPLSRGPVSSPNFCAAANMSIARVVFQRLGGFDREIASSEDQLLAMRHTASGGLIVFLPEAEAVHHDNAFDIRSYCRRSEWGSEQMIPFCLRYPDWPDNIERERVNGFISGGNPLWQNIRKLLKTIVALKTVCGTMFGLTYLLERIAPNSNALDRFYRALLGAHIFRGYRRGLKKYGQIGEGKANTSEPVTSGLTLR